MGADEFLSFPLDPTVDVRVLADVLAWGPWRTGEVSLVTRDQVLEEVAKTCALWGVELGPKAEPGLKAAVGLLADVGWVREEYGPGVCALAGSKAARQQQVAAELAADLDRLTVLTLAWGVPVVASNAKAREMSWRVADRLLRADPQPLSDFWTKTLRNRTRGSGFAQSDVTKAAVGLCGTRPLALTFRQEPPLDELAIVAQAVRIDYLAANFVRWVTTTSDLQATHRLLAALREVVDGHLVKVSRPHDRERFLGPAPLSEQTLLWQGPLVEELLRLEKFGIAHVRRLELGDIAAEQIVERASQRLRNMPDEGTLRGWWWRILKEEIHAYQRNEVPVATVFPSQSDDGDNDFDPHDVATLDPAENNRFYESDSDGRDLGRSERVRDLALGYLRDREQHSLAWALALAVLEPAEELLAGPPEQVQVRVRRLLDPKFDELGIPPRDTDAVMRAVYDALKEALAFARDDPEMTL